MHRHHWVCTRCGKSHRHHHGKESGGRRRRRRTPPRGKNGRFRKRR